MMRTTKARLDMSWPVTRRTFNTMAVVVGIEPVWRITTTRLQC